jgi:hypothetical protein
VSIVGILAPDQIQIAQPLDQNAGDAYFCVRRFRAIR